MQSLLFIILFNITAGEPDRRPGWECESFRRCLKPDGVPIKIIPSDQTSGWKYEDCQIRCEQYQGCQAVDIQWFAVDDFDYKVSTCVLYDWNNMKAWEYCTQEKDWFSCSHTGKRNSKVIADPSSPMDVQNGDMSRMPGGGLTTLSDKSDWKCRNELQCLKRGGSPLKIYYDPLTGGQPWTHEDCVSACKDYNGCVAVDIERSATVYWVHQCVLYDFDNDVQNYKFCTKAELWLTCSPKGKSDSHAVIV